MSLLLRRRMLLQSQAKGTLPSAYQQVEYIESTSDGGEYINTLFFGNQNTRIVAEFQMIDATKGCFIFGSRYGTSRAITFNIGGAPRKFVFAFDKSGNIQIVETDTQTHKVDLKNGGCLLDGYETPYTTPDSFTTSSPIALFACNDTQQSYGYLPAHMRLFSCQIYDNGVLARDYIPCYYESDNVAGFVAGLYDLVNKEFVTTTKGAFLKGADDNVL